MISQLTIWCAKLFASNELFALSNIHVICSALFKPFEHKEIHYFPLCFLRIWKHERIIYSRSAYSWSAIYRLLEFQSMWNWKSIRWEPRVCHNTCSVLSAKWRRINSKNERLWHILDIDNMFMPIFSFKNLQHFQFK
jgi:hypothetical protein